MTLVVLIGASGSGKTTIARAIEQRFGKDIRVFYFDLAGVPSPTTMVKEHGSGEAWQHATTLRCFRQLAPWVQAGQPVLFEGQTRLASVAEGIRAMGSPAYRPILVDCNDATRTARLIRDRQQPELANPDMMAWAAHLRDEARTAGCEIDTTALPLEACVLLVMQRLQPQD